MARRVPPGDHTAVAQQTLAMAMVPDAGSRDKAATKQRIAAELTPTHPAGWSDLAALRLSEARLTDRPVALQMALEAALRAVDDPQVTSSALFNVALVQQELSLRDEARAAWRGFLTREPASAWSAEARSHLARLQAAEPAAGLPVTARGGDTREIRERFGRLLAELDPLDLAQTEDRLAAAESAAEEVLSETGDALLLEAAAAARRAATSKEALARLTRGHRLFQAGFDSYQRGDLHAAREELRGAHEALVLAGSSYRHLASLYLACVTQQEERYRHSLAQLQRLAREAGGHAYWRLRGLVGWMVGLNHLLLGRPGSSIVPFNQAISAFGAAGLPDEQATSRALLAQTLFQLGREEEGWRHLHLALFHAPALTNPRHATIVYSAAVDGNRQHGRPRAAAVYQRRRNRTAEATENPKARIWSLVMEGNLAAERGESSLALDRLRQAERLADEVRDAASRQRVHSDLAVLEAILSGERGRAAALDRLASAIEFYREKGFSTPLAAAAHEMRARLYLGSGDPASAAAELAACLAIFERRLLDPANRAQRPRLEEKAQSLYGEVVLLHLDAGEAAAAFRWADRSRRFSLHSLDFWSYRDRYAEECCDDDAQPWTALESGTVFVQLDLIADQLVTWVLRHDEPIRVDRRRIDPESLGREVSTLTRRLQRGAAGELVAQSARALHATLLRNVVDSASKGERLVMALDEELHVLPVAALADSKGRPVIASRQVSRAASLASHLLAQDQARRLSATPERAVLVFSDPAFSETRWPQLRRLPHAALEGRELLALYPEAEARSGPAATAEAFLTRATRATLIHFGGHAVLNRWRPDLSMLLLADGEVRSGDLSQREIYDLDLERGPLVVLAGCETGSLAGSRGEAFSSLSRAFLSAGASAVLGSLWPVDDESATVLMTSFHHHLSTGLAPSSALRRSQLDYLGASRPIGEPHAWAAFTLFGADPV